MQFKIFNIPIPESEIAIEEMNRFLRGNRIVAIEKEFINIRDVHYWSFCIQYIYAAVGLQNATQGERKEKIDYKNVLDGPTFEVFSKLRAYRKQIAENDAVPAYAVYTDAELAEIAKLETITPKRLLTINGIGEKRHELPLCLSQQQHPRQPQQQQRVSVSCFPLAYVQVLYKKWQ